MYIFGKDFKLTYNYQITKEPSSDAPTIYIYRDSRPSRSDARAGTNAIQTISAWTDSPLVNLQKLITVTAITDPDADSNIDDYVYYIAINYKVKTGGADFLDIKPFHIGRVSGQLESLKVSIQDVLKVYPNLSSFLTDEQITNFINTAYEEVRLHFLKQHIDINNLTDLSTFYLALVYKAVSNCSYSQFTSRDDKFYARYEDFELKFKDLMTGLKVGVVNTTGDIVKGAVGHQSYKVSVR